MPPFPDNLVIRRARDNDLPEIAMIHFAAYPGIPMTLEERISHFKDDPRLPLEDNWVCERDDRLVAVFALYNFRMYRSGLLIPAGGIGRVAVTPNARLEKIAYWLMARAVQIMDQNGVPLSILYPFRHSFYRKLGWGLAEQVRFYRIPPADLPVFTERTGIKPAITREELEDVMTCYHRVAGMRNGMLVRDEPVWYEHIFKNCLVYSYRDSTTGEVEGYLILRYRPHPVRTDFITSDMIVNEMIWSNERALKGILGFLSSQRDQIKAVEYHDHFDLPFEQILKDPLMVDGKHNMTLGTETAWIGSGLMGRIIQLRKVLAQGKFGDGSGRITLNIQDELNPENSVPISVEFDSGRVEFINKKTTDLSLTTDIATFSSIYWGVLSYRDAVYLGKVEVDGKSDGSFLENVLSFPKSICLDYF